MSNISNNNIGNNVKNVNRKVASISFDFWIRYAVMFIFTPFQELPAQSSNLSPVESDINDAILVYATIS